MSENMYLFIHSVDFIELLECVRCYLQCWKRDKEQNVPVPLSLHFNNWGGEADFK